MLSGSVCCGRCWGCSLKSWTAGHSRTFPMLSRSIAIPSAQHSLPGARPSPLAQLSARPAAQRLRHLLNIYEPMEFERVQSFDDLLAANARFLSGDLHSTPYCCGLAAETGPLLASLEQLHGPCHRVFTFESQPGLRETRWVDPWFNRVFGTAGGNEFVETEQRVSRERALRAHSCTQEVGSGSEMESLQACPPDGCLPAPCCPAHPAHAALIVIAISLVVMVMQAYVDTFVEADRLPTLLAQLRRHAPSLCYFVDVPGQPEVFTTWGIPEGEVSTSSRGTPYFNVTRSRSAPTKAGLPDAPWYLSTNAPLFPGWADEEVELLAEASPALAASLQRCALVGVIATSYGPPAKGEPSLLDLLLQATSAEGEADDELVEAAAGAEWGKAEVVE